MRSKLIKWEKEHGYKAKFVAEKIGVSAPTWCMIKSGKQNPTIDTLCRFKKAFDDVEDVLLLFEDEKGGHR